MSITISIINPSPISREGLRRIIMDGGLDVVSVGSRLDDIDPLPPASSHLVLVDMPSLSDQIETLQAISEQNVQARAVILVERFDLEPMLSCFDHGAQGYAVKDMGCDALIALLHLAALGHKVMPSNVAEAFKRDDFAPLSPNLNQDLATSGAKLSQRENEVLCCLMTGYSNKRIARTLSVSEATVKVHVKAILRKLNVMNRTQAAMWATARGMSVRDQECRMNVN